MRNAFLKTVFEMARQDSRIVFMTGDLGFNVVEPFKDELPLQFVNAGVAEQNMTGMAAGMALSGKIVFTYSIANFPTLRCLEQVRNDVCYHDADVKIVSVGGGFAYGSLGTTHHATEDLGVMRMLPNMLVVAPGDPAETAEATRALIEHPGPAYLRLGKAGEPTMHEPGFDFRLGKALRVRDGADITLISTGAILPSVVAAAADLADSGVEARVLSMHTLKPLDEEAVLRAARETGAVMTVEEHSIMGGLGSAVAEVLAESDAGAIPFRRVGVPSRFSPRVGSQGYLIGENGLDQASLVASALALLGPRSAAPA